MRGNLSLTVLVVLADLRNTLFFKTLMRVLEHGLQGWIKLHRKIRNHWVFTRPDYFTAWITILFDVNHEEKHVLIKSKLLVCGRGQSLNSLDTWARLFGNWSKSKVQRFFQILEESGMIELSNETVTTRLSVCNYETYQDSRNASDTRSETQAKRSRDTNKNEKNEEECKEVKKREVKKFTPPSIEDISEYIKEKGYSINAETFFYFYDARDWRVGKVKMKNWKSALSGWASRELRPVTELSTKERIRQLMENDK